MISESLAVELSQPELKDWLETPEDGGVGEIVLFDLPVRPEGIAHSISKAPQRRRRASIRPSVPSLFDLPEATDAPRTIPEVEAYRLKIIQGGLRAHLSELEATGYEGAELAAGRTWFTGKHGDPKSLELATQSEPFVEPTPARRPRRAARARGQASMRLVPPVSTEPSSCEAIDVGEMIACPGIGVAEGLLDVIGRLDAANAQIEAAKNLSLAMVQSNLEIGTDLSGEVSRAIQAYRKGLEGAKESFLEVTGLKGQAERGAVSLDGGDVRVEVPWYTFANMCMLPERSMERGRYVERLRSMLELGTLF